jgi:glutathionylspermidine synthase
MTTLYLRDVAGQAGIRTSGMLMSEIGWDLNRRCFTDTQENEIRSIFKLYPWEWLIHEEFSPHLIESYDRMQWIEPIWKMLWSNKGILPILWELYPGHPNLLEARFGDPGRMEQYVRKPLLSREGANIKVVGLEAASASLETQGDYGEEGYVYQALAPLTRFDSNYPVIGSWVIDGVSSGIGIRESSTLVTDNQSRFQPHLFRPETS